MKDSIRKYFKEGGHKNSFVSFFAIGVCTFAIVCLSYGYGLFFGIEKFFEDILFSTRPVSSDIVILEIDNQSIEKIGQWPWKREIFAQAFSRLDTYKPKVVGLDVIMSEPSRFGNVDDNALAIALNNVSYTVVVPVEALSLNINRNNASFSENFLKPLQEFQTSSRVSLGHVNLINDRDGIVRSLPLNIKDSHGATYSGFAYKTIEKSGTVLKRGLMRDPVERIVYSGPSGSVRRVPFWKIIEQDTPVEFLKNKIIFIGATAPDLHDEKSTPFDKGTQMSGVEIQAQIANMFLKDYRLRDMSETAIYMWFFFASLIPCITFFLFSRVQLVIILNVFIGFLYLAVIIFLFNAGLVANFVHITISWVLATLTSFFYRYLSTDREKKEMRAVFSKYVSKDVLNEILSDTSKVKLGGEEKEVTIFFSDIRSFTTLSEGMSPSRLTNFLNKYFTRMTNIILEKKGVVDKYIGDAIMSFWGAPISNDNQAIDAVLACLDMVDSLEELNKENNRIGDPSINIGIGLNTGLVTVGNMGSDMRFDYTIMGDAVNIASRLEGQTKTYSVKMLMSESTKNKLGVENMEKHKIMIREVDRITVKGKTQPVTIFEIVPRSKMEEVASILKNFDHARTLYYEGKWRESIEVAEKILKGVEDGPTKVLKDRCLYFIEHEPEHWSGVYEMKSK
ncbi:MAG: adenylate/guanylate cyclase domain-containing protein [Minisyncoccia bacterium]